MGDGEKASLRLQFNPKVRLAFHGATITTDAGLLAFREFDDALGLTEIAEDYLQESRTGRNILHHLVPLLRQSIYSRLAGYDDTNDAVRLSQDPAMRVIVGWQGSERKGASTSEMGRFETEFLTQEDNRQALARMNTRWVERAMAHTLHQRVILAGIPQIKPTFLDIAPSGIPSNIIPHSKGVKCGLIRSNSPFSYSNHRPAKPKIPKPLVYAQVSPLGTSFATP